MSIYKTFKATDRVNIQFRAEGFNIFNHTQWNGLNNDVGSDFFMRPSGAHMARVFQFGLKVEF